MIAPREHTPGKLEAYTHLRGQIGEAVADLPSFQLVSPYLTATEAAAYLRTTRQGIYSLVKRGRLKPMPGRPGRLLFTRESLDNYLKSRYRT